MTIWNTNYADLDGIEKFVTMVHLYKYYVSGHYPSYLKTPVGFT
jgi:hypothetical protein